MGRRRYFWKSDCEPQFLSLVALNLQATVYEAREVVPTVDLTVIDRGVVARRLVMQTKGSVLGTDCVIPDHLTRFRPLEAAYSLTFSQTSVISRSMLFRITEHFPIASQSLNHASAIYTLKGAFRLAYTLHKRELRAKGFVGARVSSQEVHEGALKYTAGSAVLAAFTGAGSAINLSSNAAAPQGGLAGLAMKHRKHQLSELRHFRRRGSTLASRIDLIKAHDVSEPPSAAPAAARDRKRSDHARGGRAPAAAAALPVSFKRKETIARHRSAIARTVLTSSMPSTPANACTAARSKGEAAAAAADSGSDSASLASSEDESFGDALEIHHELRRMRRSERRHAAALHARLDTLQGEVHSSVSGVRAKLEEVLAVVARLEGRLSHGQAGRRTSSPASSPEGASDHHRSPGLSAGSGEQKRTAGCAARESGCSRSRTVDPRGGGYGHPSGCERRHNGAPAARLDAMRDGSSSPSRAATASPSAFAQADAAGAAQSSSVACCVPSGAMRTREPSREPSPCACSGARGAVHTKPHPKRSTCDGSACSGAADSVWDDRAPLADATRSRDPRPAARMTSSAQGAERSGTAARAQAQVPSSEGAPGTRLKVRVRQRKRDGTSASISPEVPGGRAGANCSPGSPGSSMPSTPEKDVAA